MAAPESPPPVKTRLDRLRSGALTFITIAIINSFFAIMSLSALKAPPAAIAATTGLRRFLLENPLIGTAVFASFSILAIVIGMGLVRDRAWSFRLGKILAGIQIALILLVTQLGGFVIVTFFLGIMAMTNLHLAEAFEENDVARPSRAP